MSSKRTLLSLAVFAGCLLVLLGGTAWTSVMVLDLDRRAAAARRQAGEEENVRLALWRMDSTVAPILARESARPYFTYAPFYPGDRPYTRMLEPLRRGEALVASPLLTEVVEHVTLHFQIAPDGAVTSPEVPGRGLLDRARASGLDEGRAMKLAGALDLLRPELERPKITQRLGAAERELAEAEREAAPREVDAPPTQRARSVLEWSMRSRSVQQAANVNANPYNQASPSKQAQGYVRSAPGRDGQAADGAAVRVRPERTVAYGNIQEGPMTPIWLGASLVLVRRLEVDGAEYFQGVVLDWPSLERALLDDVRDLAPSARLVPAGVAQDAETRRLASLPVRLVAGPIPLAPDGAWPVGLLLGVAWAGVLLASAAAFGLVVGALSLSERRATFVSAVTHELRTPLTTFRMYSEMLALGMVRDPAKQKSYLETLHTESIRLGHLVENVLAYARIERGRATGRIEPLELGLVLPRIGERLTDRAKQAGMTLSLPAARELDGARILADATALEQILFNLVDNAAKYAKPAAPGEADVTLTVEVRGEAIVLRVCDRGPGVPADERRRLFSPFSKSAQRAATSAPGVGLGLALSRRLARTMRGDLVLEPSKRGASFALRLPRAPATDAAPRAPR